MYGTLWNILRRTLLGVIAATLAVAVALGWRFVWQQATGVAVFVATLNVFAMPFVCIAELSLRRKPRGYFVTAATYAQVYLGAVIGFKYIFSWSLLRQFYYNASSIYISFFVCVIVLILVDEFIFRRAARPLPDDVARADVSRRLVRFVRACTGPATVVAVAAVLLVFIQRSHPIIPRIGFSFLQTGGFYQDMSGGYAVAPLAGNLRIPDAMQVMVPPGDSSRFCVASLRGQIFVVETDGHGFQQRLMLDLSPTIGALEGENGLQGAAFGPHIESAGDRRTLKLVVLYAFGTGEQNINRLSVFEVDYDRLTVHSAEQVLIDQVDPHFIHNGGGLTFGSDGYLYVAMGDGGPVNDGSNKSQLIDEDFFSGILRIDLYGKDPDAVKLIERRPRNGTTAGYFIPKDNPFVGQPGALEEFWALGLRNPFRITPSTVSGAIWVGDVGQAYFEEVNLVRAGDNCQWSYREGPFEYSLSRFGGRKPEPFIGVETGPLFAYARQEARGCVISGTVYQGSMFPELRGRYLFGDHLSGEMFAIDDREGKPDEVLRILHTRGREGWKSRGMTSIAEFAGRILFTLLGEGEDGSTLMVLKRSDEIDASTGPAPRSESVIEQFRLHCARCHGETGTPTVEWVIPQMRPPRDLADPAWQASVTDEDIERIIRVGGAALSQGPSAMPPWEGVLSPEEIKAMAKLIRGFRK